MNYILEIIAFVSGAVVMILELDGSRIVAPYLGTSVVVWTGLIGVILGSLSLGYWWGGKIADKSATFLKLGKILAGSAILVFSIAYLKNILVLALLIQNHLIVATLIGTILLFAPSTVLLGMVSPYVARLKMKTVETSGQTIGSLYAISTLGSIIGTFLGGFLLISLLGSTTIILLLSATLFILAAATFWNINKTPNKAFVFCLILATLSLTIKPPDIFGGEIIKDVDTLYSRFWIEEGTDKATGRPTRYLTNSIYGLQSGMFLDNPTELLFPYTKVFDLAKILRPNLKKILMIGAGAYSYPKHFIQYFPDAQMDLVEIDPKLTELAETYFAFKRNPRVNIINEDGRTFLNKNHISYDIILNDTFLSYLNIPFQLTTVEAVKKMYGSLEPQGVVMTNIVSAITGPKAMFLEAEYATYKEVFPSVYLIQVTDTVEIQRQNIMLIAFKSVTEQSKLATALKNLSGVKVNKIFTINVSSEQKTLSDEFAPVEKYATEMLL